jgi:hypothetical protein
LLHRFSLIRFSLFRQLIIIIAFRATSLIITISVSLIFYAISTRFRHYFHYFFLLLFDIDATCRQIRFSPFSLRLRYFILLSLCV